MKSIFTRRQLRGAAIAGALCFGSMCAMAALPGAQKAKPKPAPSKPQAAAPAVSPALIAAGSKAFQSNCAGCHAVAGKGGTAGPDLTNTGGKPGHDAKWLLVQVETPTAHNPSSTMPAYKGKVKPAEMSALVAYLSSLKAAAATAGVKAAPPDPTIVAKIEKLGGSCRQIAENDGRVEVAYNLTGPTVTDAALIPLKTLKGVYELNLARTGISDAGLAHIKGLAELTILHLELTKISDAGLVHLKGLKNLTYLNVYGTGVTDTGLTNLSGLTKLQHLYVWQTKVTPAGVEALKKALPKLEIVTGVDMEPAKKP